MDFFTVPTATFRVLYVWFAIRHSRREIVHWSVTESPTAPWVVQQLRETFPFDDAHGRSRYLVLDRDTIFSGAVVAAIESMGLEATRTSYQSPWQNGVAERFVGTVRRDLLDHAIVLDEHLRRLLSEFLAYYHGIGPISESRRTRRWLVPWNCALQAPPPSRPDGESEASTTGTSGPRPRRRGRPEGKHVWAPVRQSRRTGQPGCACTPTPGCRGRPTPRATLVFRYQERRIEYWRGTAHPGGAPADPSRLEGGDGRRGARLPPGLENAEAGQVPRLGTSKSTRCGGISRRHLPLAGSRGSRGMKRRSTPSRATTS